LLAPTPTSILFPYTTLFRSLVEGERCRGEEVHAVHAGRVVGPLDLVAAVVELRAVVTVSGRHHKRPVTAVEVLRAVPEEDQHGEDRKSTRLNSSHSQISYAV